MTPQEIFNTVYIALHKQGVPAVTSGVCTLLDTATGNRCAIGHLLTEKEIENERWYDVPVVEAHRHLVNDMRRAHDYTHLYHPSEWFPHWKKKMARVAKMYDLTVPTVD